MFGSQYSILPGYSSPRVWPPTHYTLLNVYVEVHTYVTLVINYIVGTVINIFGDNKNSQYITAGSSRSGKGVHTLRGTRNIRM